MIRAALLNLATLSAEARENILRRMDDDTAVRYGESFSKGKGFQRAAGRDLSRKLAGSVLGIAADAVPLTHNAEGRPILKGLPLFISASHSEDWVLSGIADAPLGCDVQTPRVYPVEAIAGFFSPADREALREDPSCLTRLWTRRESLTKLLGDDFRRSQAVLRDAVDVESRYDCMIYEGVLPSGALWTIAVQGYRDEAERVEWLERL